MQAEAVLICCVAALLILSLSAGEGASQRTSNMMVNGQWQATASGSVP